MIKRWRWNPSIASLRNWVERTCCLASSQDWRLSSARVPFEYWSLPCLIAIRLPWVKGPVPDDNSSCRRRCAVWTRLRYSSMTLASDWSALAEPYPFVVQSLGYTFVISDEIWWCDALVVSCRVQWSLSLDSTGTVVSIFYRCFKERFNFLWNLSLLWVVLLLLFLILP